MKPADGREHRYRRLDGIGLQGRQDPPRCGELSDIALHRGEAALWAQGLYRNDDWILCGPERAGLRCGVRLGFREWLVSLDCLLEDVGHRPNPMLRPPYTRRWYDRAVGQMVIAEASE